MLLCFSFLLTPYFVFSFFSVLFFLFSSLILLICIIYFPSLNNIFFVVCYFFFLPFVLSFFHLRNSFSRRLFAFIVASYPLSLPSTQLSSLPPSRSLALFHTRYLLFFSLLLYLVSFVFGKVSHTLIFPRNFLLPCITPHH